MSSAPGQETRSREAEQPEGRGFRHDGAIELHLADLHAVCGKFVGLRSSLWGEMGGWNSKEVFSHLQSLGVRHSTVTTRNSVSRILGVLFRDFSLLDMTWQGLGSGRVHISTGGLMVHASAPQASDSTLWLRRLRQSPRGTGAVRLQLRDVTGPIRPSAAQSWAACVRWR